LKDAVDDLAKDLIGDGVVFGLRKANRRDALTVFDLRALRLDHTDHASETS
jgi:hypothetical protein